MLELPGFQAVLTMNERGQNSIQNLIEALAGIFRQESQNKMSILFSWLRPEFMLDQE